MDELREEIPRRRHSPAISRDDVIRFCTGGAPATAPHYGLDPALCATIEAGGNTLQGEEPTREQLEAVADHESLEMGRWSFAYIGGGNHFLELQVVDRVLDPAAARTLGLDAGSVVMMFHTGSERLGHDLGRLYAWRKKTEPKRRFHLWRRKVALHLLRDVHSLDDLRRRWALHFSRQDYIAIPADSREGRRLALTLKLAANYGYANRVAVTGLIQSALQRATGARDLKLGIVADLSHNTIMREQIGSRRLWVHRHNAARAVGPSGMPDGHPYRALGQPVMVPGTARTSSYMVVGCDGAEASLYSVDHGAGRTVDRFQAAGMLTARPGRTTRRYTYAQRGPEILEHLSDEGIDEVMTVATAGGLARPVVRMRPVAVLKA
jgi:RNA-splicing ligase RtcB